MRPSTSKSAWIKLRPWQRPHHTTRRSISTDLSRLSTVHQGTAFEERSLNLLHKTMSMSLKRVGGREDGGIDLLGWWWLPPTNDSLLNHDDIPTSPSKRRRIRVIGQCKAEKKKLGPKYVRELEGVLYRFQTNSFDDNSQLPMVALLISESEFTKSAILRANSSPIPFFLLHLPAANNTDDTTTTTEADEENLGMALCNPALCGSDGLLKGNMEVRWERGGLWGDGRGRPAVWWRNQKLR